MLSTVFPARPDEIEAIVSELTEIHQTIGAPATPENIAIAAWQKAQNLEGRVALLEDYIAKESFRKVFYPLDEEGHIITGEIETRKYTSLETPLTGTLTVTHPGLYEGMARFDWNHNDVRSKFYAQLFFHEQIVKAMHVEAKDINNWHAYSSSKIFILTPGEYPFEFGFRAGVSGKIAKVSDLFVSFKYFGEIPS